MRLRSRVGLLMGLLATLLAPFRAAAQVGPDTLPVASLVEAARAAARANRNAESAALFARALQRDPSLRPALLFEYADQLTYSDQASAAVPLYRELLGAQPPPERETALRLRRQLALALSWSGELGAALREYDALLVLDPEDHDARLGRARVLSWLGRLGPAGRAYGDALTRYPGDLEARRDLARVQVWRGRHREGLALVESFLAEHPEDREARLLEAQTLFWMGRPDRAREVAEPLDRETPPGSEFRGRLDVLLEDLRRAAAPLTRTETRYSTQSDHLTIRGVRAEQRARWRGGLGEGGLFYQGLEYAPRRAAGEADRAIREHRIGVQGRVRSSDAVQVTGFVQADLIRPPGDGKDHAPVTYNAFATLWPGDEWRLDVGSRRETLDNERSLLEGIVATSVSASVDWVPDEKSRITLRGDRGAFSDDNRRLWAEVEVARRVWDRPHVILGMRGARFTFEKVTDHGYFNPESYQGGVIWSHGWGQLGKATWWEYDLSLGRERLSPGEGKPIWSASGSLSRTLVQDLDLRLSYQRFSSRHFSSSGFERETFVISLDYAW